MKTHFVPCLKITALTIILFGVVYPLVITAIAQLTRGGGSGETVLVNGKVVGFELIGQSFTSDRYFNDRPSAVGYNAASTGGSNKGPTNPDYLKEVQGRIDDFLAKNPDVKRAEVPVDLVTASGGGLDPHISPQAALIQVPRIAKARNMDPEVVRRLVQDNIEEPLLGLFGPRKVNVLRLNIAIDQLSQGSAH